MAKEHPQYTLQWDTTDAYAFEGKTKTRIFHDLASLRQEGFRRKQDPSCNNVRAFILWTTVRKEDIDL